MTTDARTLRREQRKRDLRVAMATNARRALGTLTPGCEILILTDGSYSLADVAREVLAQIGPADVAISTWSAHTEELEATHRLLEDGTIQSIRWIVDRSYCRVNRPHALRMERLFGEENIRAARSHAKFIVFTNDRWQLALRTSANYNTNPRMETIEISDDGALCAFLGRYVAAIYAEERPGIEPSTSQLPLLLALRDDTPAPRDDEPPAVSIGKMIPGARLTGRQIAADGYVSTGPRIGD